MKTSDFYYDLPEELIAQDPLTDRAASRLLYMNRRTGETVDDTFRNVGSYLHPGDVLVINDTKVIPARLLGITPVYISRKEPAVLDGVRVIRTLDELNI